MDGEQWPVDFLTEYNRRITLFDKLRHDRALWRNVREYYRNNPIDWINDCCITFDPRAVDPQPRLMPFVLFKRQREFVMFLQECFDKKEPGLIEKCRDVGASYISIAYTLWLWLFHSNMSIGWGSRKEEYVDKIGDPKSIFEKMRQIIRYLPDYMLPIGFAMDKHATYMKLINPENGSVITGEAGTNQGRGNRTSLYFCDEAAHYEQAELIEAALGDSTNVQISISSVNGSANLFYRRRMAGEVWEPGKEIEKGRTRVFVFDWRDHPGKTQDWYNLRRKRAEDEGLLHMFAQEVDRDYSGSQDKIIIPAEWVRAAIDAHVKLGFIAKGKVIAGQDIADGGGDKNALTIIHGVVAKLVTAWGGEAGDAAGVAIPLCLANQVDELFYDQIGVGAGFKVATNHMIAAGQVGGRLKILPWNAAQSPLEPEKNTIPNDKQSPKNEDMYANLKAQAWFRVRARFLKTYNAVVHGQIENPDELVSLPSDLENLHQLQMELSQAVYKNSTSNGKTIVDKQPEGARSPNLADSFVMAFNPVRKPRGFFDLD